ncbi:hypothetical protein ACJIZ3_017857 [Penstemon smallii]|uniref:DUF3741 domain-containing protein n=1 Tax=Penstemon smallii TaxID=265156 RepID=A0ABD3SWQ9_9LAMI
MKNLSSSNSKNGPSPGCCIARVIRRILCISNAPSSYPFDHFKEEENDPLVPGAPGIVARLMGLESSTTPITRNPSTDSLRKSSRKIIPTTYQEFEDENFFILSFDQEEENTEFIPSKCKKKKKKKSRRRRRRKSFHQEWDKENEGFKEGLEENLDPPNHNKKDSRSIVLGPLKNSCQKSERFMKMKAKQDKLGIVKIENECDSENSSPNSVLDFLGSETATSGNISRLANSKLRRTLSEELENFRKSIKDGEEKKHTRLMNRNQNYAEIWDKIGSLAAREMIKSSWLEAQISKNHIHFKEIGRDIASEILQQLLDELLINMI